MSTPLEIRNQGAAPSTDVLPSPSRRQFCAHACQAASLVAVGALVPACGGKSPTSPSSPGGGGNQNVTTLGATVSGRTVTVPIDAAGALGATGGVGLLETTLGPFLVSRTSATTFGVMTAVCTHEQCTVSQYNGQLFVCPCHNSKYTTAGSVANGPASAPLRGFSSTFAAGVLTFTA